MESGDVGQFQPPFNFFDGLTEKRQRRIGKAIALRRVDDKYRAFSWAGTRLSILERTIGAIHAFSSLVYS